jgi:4-azaleucine resistance transporter AzlC
MKQSTYAQAVRDAIPIMIAYFPIAVTFGVISTGSGIPWFITFLISACVYAGGAQFMLVSLALAGTSAISTVLTVLLVNLRHVLYGTTLGPAFSKWTELKKWIAAFGLTDEVFAVTSSRIHQEPLTPAYQIVFAFACYGSWLAGTAVGATVGRAVPTSISDILVFALPALFMALLFIGQRSEQRPFPYFIAAIFGAAVSVVASLIHWGSIGIVIGAVVGATIGMYLQDRIASFKPSTPETVPTRD